MSAKDSKKAGGAKSQRSETITVRLNPETRYLAELAARALRRTLSSYIELVVEQSFENIEMPFVIEDDELPATLEASRLTLWDPVEPDRFYALGQFAPSLMVHDEQKLWKLVKETWAITHPTKDNSMPVPGDRTYSKAREMVRKHWDLLKTCAESGELPSVVAKRIRDLDAKE